MRRGADRAASASRGGTRSHTARRTTTVPPIGYTIRARHEVIILRMPREGILTRALWGRSRRTVTVFTIWRAMCWSGAMTRRARTETTVAGVGTPTREARSAATAAAGPTRTTRTSASGSEPSAVKDYTRSSQPSPRLRRAGQNSSKNRKRSIGGRRAVPRRCGGER